MIQRPNRTFHSKADFCPDTVSWAAIDFVAELRSVRPTAETEEAYRSGGFFVFFHGENMVKPSDLVQNLGPN
jgi:hypothetical protein